LIDIFVAPTAAATTPVTVVPTVSGALFGEPFTIDSAYTLFYTNVDVANQTGTLQAMPSGGGSTRPLGSDVWFHLLARASKLAFNDHWRASGERGRADLRFVDLASSADPTLIANLAEADFFLSAAGDKVAFAYLTAPGREGLYVVDLP